MKIATKYWVFGLCLLMLTGILSSCAGYDLGDVVRVKTPNAIQQQTGLPKTISLNDASAEYQAWFDMTTSNGARWKDSIERGEQMRAVFGQLTLSALDEVGPTLAGVPVLGPMLPALTGLVGMFIGTSRLRKGKEDSYNAGLEVGKTFISS